MVPTCRKDYKEKRFLLRKDVKFGTDPLLVHMKWSKTIQFCKRVLVCQAHLGLPVRCLSLRYSVSFTVESLSLPFLLIIS